MAHDGEVGTSRRDLQGAMDGDLRTEWTTPVLRRLKASEAETGILMGPEILILLS